MFYWTTRDDVVQRPPPVGSLLKSCFLFVKVGNFKFFFLSTLTEGSVSWKWGFQSFEEGMNELPPLAVSSPPCEVLIGVAKGKP